MRTNPTNRNHRLVREKFWVLQLQLVGLEKSPTQVKIAGCIFTHSICVICNCKAEAITDHPQYRRSSLKLSKYGTPNTRVIQSIRNRRLIREEFWVLQLRLAGLSKSLSTVNLARRGVAGCICVICNRVRQLPITQNTILVV